MDRAHHRLWSVAFPKRPPLRTIHKDIHRPVKGQDRVLDLRGESRPQPISLHPNVPKRHYPLGLVSPRKLAQNRQVFSGDPKAMGRHFQKNCLEISHRHHQVGMVGRDVIFAFTQTAVIFQMILFPGFSLYVIRPRGSRFPLRKGSRFPLRKGKLFPRQKGGFLRLFPSIRVVLNLFKDLVPKKGILAVKVFEAIYSARGFLLNKALGHQLPDEVFNLAM